MAKIAILYGSTSNNTENIAEVIAKKLIDHDVDIFNVADIAADDIKNYSNLILGTSTWGLGDLQDDWDSFLSDFSNLNFSGKKIALFGLGDSMSYPDTFVDGMGTIYNEIADKGGVFIGSVETEGYSYDESTSVIDGKFIGLALDHDNESHLSKSRIENWIQVISPEFN